MDLRSGVGIGQEFMSTKIEGMGSYWLQARFEHVFHHVSATSQHFNVWL